jgi:hypothetical protein
MTALSDVYLLDGGVHAPLDPASAEWGLARAPQSRRFVWARCVDATGTGEGVVGSLAALCGAVSVFRPSAAAGACRCVSPAADGVYRSAPRYATPTGCGRRDGRWALRVLCRPRATTLFPASSCRGHRWEGGPRPSPRADTRRGGGRDREGGPVRRRTWPAHPRRERPAASHPCVQPGRVMAVAGRAGRGCASRAISGSGAHLPGGGQRGSQPAAASTVRPPGHCARREPLPRVVGVELGQLGCTLGRRPVPPAFRADTVVHRAAACERTDSHPTSREVCVSGVAPHFGGSVHDG